MAKLFSLFFLCLVFYCSGFRVQRTDDMELFKDEHQVKKLAIPERRDNLLEMIAEDDDEPEAISNTYRLLDAVMLDEATIKGGTVEWFYGKGLVVECIDGKKTIKPRCRWSGLVQEKGESEPKLEKLQVIGKYCNKANLIKPDPKVVDCSSR